MRLKFSELFEGLGYSPRCAELSGTEVEIAGYVVDTHDGRAQMLVAEPGGCPHCSPVPAIALPGFQNQSQGAVTLRGMLSYGFFIDRAAGKRRSCAWRRQAGDGTADLILIQNALVLTPVRRGQAARRHGRQGHDRRRRAARLGEGRGHGARRRRRARADAGRW